MFDLHTIIKNNERAEQDARERRIALIKSELAKLDHENERIVYNSLKAKFEGNA